MFSHLVFTSLHAGRAVQHRGDLSVKVLEFEAGTCSMVDDMHFQQLALLGQILRFEGGQGQAGQLLTLPGTAQVSQQGTHHINVPQIGALLHEGNDAVPKKALFLFKQCQQPLLAGFFVILKAVEDAVQTGHLNFRHWLPLEAS
jgi:hypothetical protein